MTAVDPHETAPLFKLRYFAYVRSRSVVEVTYWRLLSLALYRSPPAKYISIRYIIRGCVDIVLHHVQNNIIVSILSLCLKYS